MEDANDTYQLVFHPSAGLKEKLVEEIHWIDDEHKAIAEKMIRTMSARLVLREYFNGSFCGLLYTVYWAAKII